MGCRRSEIEVALVEWLKETRCGKQTQVVGTLPKVP